ncbi:MAG: nucleoside triphosphate pyrophosphohydrolase [Steroidobacteraceae bacterium]
MTAPQPLGAATDFAGLRRLLSVMRALRDPAAGCPWDLAQDSRSLARYTLEEAYEVVAAIDSGSEAALRDELGDLLFQVVFHAQLASERGHYEFDDVARAIADKLQRRHPHVFADPQAGAQQRDAAHWETIKAEERAAHGAAGVLDDVPLALPALLRAVKLGKRAASVGFDWSDAAGARAKVQEELAEVDAAVRGEGTSSVEEELGDLLLATTSLARHLGVDPETALRGANGRFEARFRAMEALAQRRGLALSALDAGALDQLWEQVKQGVQS